MSRKRVNYSTALKTRLVLEVLENESTLAEIASKNNITPKNLQSWKKKFLENAEMAMEPSKAVKEYKNENAILQNKIDEYAKVVGKLTVEKDWLSGKLSNLDLSKKKSFIESKLSTISVSRQCELIKLNRSSLFYKSRVNNKKESIEAHIIDIFNSENKSCYGYKKVHQQLLEDGYKIGANTVLKYRNDLGLKAILAVKPKRILTKENKEHQKYSYKLRGLKIIRANQVWSTDITYIKTNMGMIYLATVIDWYSKAVLSWKISNIMDTNLVMGVLNEALSIYGKPEIFNTDQGSQYTSAIHTQTLKDNGIIISMDGKGRATDNICIERFWRSAKVENIYLNQYNSVKELKSSIRNYMYFYNNDRFHETLNYKKPMNVYYESLKINNENYDNLGQFVA